VKALVYVTLKPDVLDPQGEAIRKACGSLGYAAIGSVRQGKLFEIELEAQSEPEARRLLEELSDKLLANTVIEDFRVAEVDGSRGRR
jgi:phosphoribosylformylglycinamidine synthase subunit PurS